MATILLMGCEGDEIDSSVLEGQWILQNISCFCYFGEEPKFDQHYIWFFPDKGLMVANGNGAAATFKEPGQVYSYTIKDQLLGFNDDSRKYAIEINQNQLSLRYIDNPQIADDEITYIFTRGSAEQSCLDVTMVEKGPCTKEYMPVCGCDGIVYGNACEAEDAGIQSWVQGACPK